MSACNSTGCGTTADIYVTEHMRDTVGYFKPRSGASEPRQYGVDVALSADGKAMAVISGETIGARTNTLVVSVYRKGANGWVEERRLVPSLVQDDTAGIGQGRRLAINGDGTVVAVGTPAEFALYPNHPRNRGAVYVFRRTGTTWAQEAKFSDGETTSNSFGLGLDLDDAGQTLVVSRDQFSWTPQPVDVYRRGPTGWTLDTQITKADDAGGCGVPALSGDGRVMVQHCDTSEPYVEIREAPTWSVTQRVATKSRQPAVDISYDGSVIVVPTDRAQPPGATWTPWMMVLRRTGGTWEPDPAFTHVGKARNPPTGISVAYGWSVAISRDGRFVAVGDPGNRNGGTGVVRGPVPVASESTGAIFVYERKASSWALRNMIKSNVLDAGSSYGYSLAFGDNGKVLAVGNHGQDGGARGIDGDQTDTSAPDSGAVWLY